MADKIIKTGMKLLADGSEDYVTLARLKDMGDGTNAEVVAIAGTSSQAIPDFETASEIAAAWQNFANVNWAGGDFVTSVSGLNGQAIVALSGSPLTTGESVVVNINKAVAQPCSLEIAASFVRTGISFATASLFANESTTGLADTVPSPINIVSCYQSSAVQGAAYSGSAGTVMHMTLDTALPAVGSNQAVYIGDWINITGLLDTRLNYPNACINYISPDRKTLAVGFSDEAALPSLAVATITPTLGTAKANFYNNFSGARNAFGLRLTGVTSTSAAVVSIFGGDDNQVSGTLLGDHRTTIGTSAPNYVSGGNWGQYEIRANSRYLLDCSWGASVILDKQEQAHAGWTPRDSPRTSVKPASGALMYPRFRLYKPVSMSRPVAKCVSAAHAAASNVTVITMDIAPSVAGLAVGNYVTLRGNRDQTNFANSTTAVVISAINEGAKQITIAWGSSTIATGYGGSVNLINGSKDVPGVINIAAQSVVSRVADGANWLDVVGNTTWAGLNLGDYVELHGFRDATTGADLALDGAWEVAHVATTVLTLKPIFNISGARVSPALGTLVSTNCGGNVILRPTLRSHDLMVTSRGGEQVVGIDGQGTLRSDKALPVYGMGGSVTAAQGTVASIGTGGVGAWIVRNAAHRTVDIASAALTTVGQTTSTAIDVTGNVGTHQFFTDATAVTGTSPRMFTRLQGSYTNAANEFFNIYDTPVLTNATDKLAALSPNIPVEFPFIRFIRDVRGTTPSFTNSVTRMTRPGAEDKRVRRMNDRVLSLVAVAGTASTEYLLVMGCNKLKIDCQPLTGATVAAAVKVQVCYGNPAIATNWIDLPSATLTCSATLFTTSADVDLPTGARFARLVVTTQGTGVVADTYELCILAREV